MSSSSILGHLTDRFPGYLDPDPALSQEIGSVLQTLVLCVREFFVIENVRPKRLTVRDFLGEDLRQFFVSKPCCPAHPSRGGTFR